MSSFQWRAKVLASTVLAGVMWAAPAAAQQPAAPPDFSSSQFGWVRVGQGGPDFDAVPGQVPPVANDPGHPFVNNGGARQPTYRIADLNNPNLKPWVKEHMKKDNDEVLAGKIAFSARQSCLPAGVPGFMAYGGPTPLYFVQTPKEVWLLFSGDHQVRRVYMDVPHSENPKPSWYGESVGHYEGDTLVVDTIAQNTKTVVDPYRTPHTDQLHVVERWKIAVDGNTVEVSVYVEDPGAFTTPWTAVQRWRRIENAPILPVQCNENNSDFFNQGLVPLPEATKPDF